MSGAIPKILLSACLAIFLNACDQAPPVPRDQGRDVALQPGEHLWTTPDGNRMPYVVHGSGDATVVLVHCWMCDRTFWSEQIPVLEQRYRTIVLDLPGHGDATAERDEWTVSGYGQDVAGLIESLALDDVVLVGHSMGGPVSLRAAALAGDRVRGVVAVDTLHDAEFEFSSDDVQAYFEAFGDDFATACASFVEQMFPEEGVADIEAYVRETSCVEQKSEIGIALMRDFGRIDMRRLFSDAGVPIRAVNAAAPNPTRIETNRKYADFDARLVENVGHYFQMTRPDLFNPLLLEAIDELLEPNS